MDLTINSSTSTIETKSNGQPKTIQAPNACYGGEKESWTIHVTGTPMGPYQPNQDCLSRQLVASQPSSIANNWVKIPIAHPGQLVQWELIHQRQQVSLQSPETDQSREVPDASVNFPVHESKRPGTIRASPESDQPDQQQLGSPEYPIVIDDGTTSKVSSKRKRKLDTCGATPGSSFSPQTKQGSVFHWMQRKQIFDAFSFSSGPSNSGESRLIILFHQKRLVIQKQVLLSHLDRIGSAVKVFARSQDTFKKLSVRDQEVLLRNNIPLYIQYILARYVSSSSGVEQIAWILGYQLIPQLMADPRVMFNLVSIQITLFTRKVTKS